MKRAVALWLVIIAMIGAIQPAAANDIAYRVKRGDTLIDLAERYMVRGDAWREVSRINRIADPNVIQPNRTIRIPLHLLKYQALDGRLASWRGTVTVDGAAPQQGMRIAEGTRVITSPSSFATVQLGDGSRVTIPSQSSVVFGRMRRITLTGALDIDVVVEKGRAETNVSKKSNSDDRYQLRSPIAVSAVRGTVFRIAYAGEGEPSLTEVVEGSVAVASSDRPAAATPVGAGFGAGVSTDGNIATEKLLPAPEPIAPGRAQKEPVASFAAKPIEGAIAYRIQIAEDAGFVGMLAEQRSEQPKLAVTDLPNGTLFARIAAIAPSGLTGSDETFSFQRRLAGLSGSVEGDAPGTYRFRWLGVGEGQRRYQFRLWREGAALPIVDETGLTSDSIAVTDLAPGTYVWRVGLVQIEGGEAIENWTAPEKLVVPVPER